MSKTYRVGVIGFAHMHINSLVKQFSEHPQVEFVACADTVPDQPEIREAAYTRGWNLKNALENYGIPNVYEDYHALLVQESVDIIITCAENAKHAAVVEAAAAANAHVVVEKPMANSLAHALRMTRACESAGTSLIINWPTTWSPAIRQTKAVIDSGVIGRVLEVKFRGGHTGPLGSGATHPGVSQTAAPMTGVERGATWWHQIATGGGTMLDYCCYGSKLAHWYIGEEGLAAIGMRANLNSHWGDAEDNAAMLVRFPGAMGLFEGSWTTLDHGVSPGPIVYGTEGTLVVERKNEQAVRLDRGYGDPVYYDCEPLPEGRSTIAEEMIHHLDTGDALHPTLDQAFNLKVMAILDAGIRSTDSGRLETINNPTWQVG